jgi:hypothetical protein
LRLLLVLFLIGYGMYAWQDLAPHKGAQYQQFTEAQREVVRKTIAKHGNFPMESYKGGIRMRLPGGWMKVKGITLTLKEGV